VGAHVYVPRKIFLIGSRAVKVLVGVGFNYIGLTVT